MEHLKQPSEEQGLITTSHRIAERLKFILVLLVIAEVSLYCINIAGSFDFPWQLAEGNYLLDHGQVEHTVLKAYGEISPHFENEYILYEILISGINRTVGWIGLSIFFSLLCLCIYLPCLLAFFRAGHRYGLMDLFLFLLGQFLIDMRLSARPELIGDICYVLTGIMLMRWPGRSWTGTQVLTLGLVFCIWANAHGTFLLGIAMLGLWYIQLVIFEGKSLLASRNFRFLLPGVAAVIGCAVNPFGFYRLIQPFQLHSLLWGQATSLEMLPVTSGAFLLPMFWTITAILVLLTRAHDRKYFWFIAMLVLLQYMTFQSIRYNVFIGLSLLIVAWDGLKHPRETFSPHVFRLLFAMARMSVYFALVLIFIYINQSILYAKFDMLRTYFREVYPKTQLATVSSFNWLREHPTHEYYLLSYLAAGSSAQMPGNNGVHPLIDSGTHRYSDRVNELHYYGFYSPKTFQLILSKLNINAIAVNNSNIYWAPVLNADPNWRLVQIQDDSQLYLRTGTDGSEADPLLYSKWEKDGLARLEHPSDITNFTVLRGLNLRPDAESLRLLITSSDVDWVVDPELTYLEDWLDHVPDPLVSEALKRIQGLKDDSSVGLQILFSLRLHHDQEAAEVAQNWKPTVFNLGYQSMQMLRADAFLHVGDVKSARAILDSFWPKPRYSLRWARLCRQVYADDPKAMPKNALLLTDMADETGWQDETIAVLNQNIQRMMTSPH